MEPTSLFIIGNGFDVAHGFPTRYADFRDYLCRHFNVDEDSDALVPEAQMMPDGGEKYDPDEMASYIVQVIDLATGCGWGDLESCLGNQLYRAVQFDLRAVDIEGSDNAIGNDWDVNMQLSEGMRHTFSEMKRLFWKWVHEELGTMDYAGFRSLPEIAAALLSKLMENAVFLSFNYTYTLERMYRVAPEKILHIHGTVDAPDEDILFGHGDDGDIEHMMPNEWGAADHLNTLKRFLRKDTKHAIQQHQGFFDGLDGVTDIYSYGFSFSPADEVYLDELEKHLIPAQVTWHLNNWDLNVNPQYREKLEKRGYKVGAAIW